MMFSANIISNHGLREARRGSSQVSENSDALFLARFLSTFLASFHELPDQVFGGLIGLFLRLATSINCVRYFTAPHKIIGSQRL
jgi:hypothetical protein